MTCSFIYGPSFDDLQSAAFEEVDAASGDGPERVLWLEQNDHRTSQVADAWAEEFGSLRLRVSSLDTAVGEWHENVTGPRTVLEALTRRQLVDQALRSLEDGVLTDAYRYRDEVLDLFTALEAEGYDSADRIEELVAESPLPDRAGAVLEEVYSTFEEGRKRTMTGEEYTQSEAYRRLLTSDESIGDLLAELDVVVLSGYYDLSANQRALIERLDGPLDVIVVLPLVGDLASGGGANAVAAEASAFYADLDSDPTYVPPESSSGLAETGNQLYTATNEVRELEAETLRWVEAPTPDREVRQVARSLRNRLGRGEVAPDDVLVVVPGLISYREHIEDIFAANGIEAVTFANKLLYQTHTGDAMLDLVDICKEGAGTAVLARLATNPAVSLPGIDASEVADRSRRLPTDDHERLLDELDEESRAALEELLGIAERVAAADGHEVITALRDLIDYVNLEINIERFGEIVDGFDAQMESRAYRRVNRVLDAIGRVERALDVDNVLTRVSDELDQVRVPPPRNPTDGVVEVVGPRDAFMQSYDHLYLVGVTAQDFPPNPDRPRFFEELEEGLNGIDPASDRSIARYQFATMLANAESVYITTPDSTVDDEPVLESAVLDELARVTGVEPTDHDLGNGSVEDVQRAISQMGQDRPASIAVNEAIKEGVFEDTAIERVRRGVTTAEHRADPARTPHDGQITAETVAALHSIPDREPYSPTQLTQYARCGFQYYMDRVLDIEAPEEYKLEPDPLDLGSLVHDILEQFYTGLQAEPGDLVDPSTYDPDVLEVRMLEAAERAVDELALPFDDAFFDRWMQALLAGLANPELNDYYHVDEAGIHESAQGLLIRFLAEERDRDDQPGWFEVSMDLSDDEDATLDLELPDGRNIPIGGRIDRVSVDRSDLPPSGIVHDYKTGDRSPGVTVDGVEFQLPLYAMAANQHFEGSDVVTPVDAAFYVLDPPTEVNEKWTLRYYMARYGDASDADYEWFLDTVTPRRVGDIVGGIEAGAFEPTVLDADAAKCRFCDYAAVCDVRYHQRRAVIEEIDADTAPGYVPRAARADSLLDEMGGDEE